MVIAASGNISSPRWDAWDLNRITQLAKQQLTRRLFGRHVDLETWPDLFDIEESPGPWMGTPQQPSPRRVKSLWPSVKCEHYECSDSECQICAMKDDDSVIYLDDQIENPASPWLPNLHLNHMDKAELISGEMLSDKHIHAAQTLLTAQFLQFGGFQNTLLGQTSLTFRPVDCDRESVQILHTRGNHWVLTSCFNGVVEVYDTLYETVSRDLMKQMNEIYTNCPKDAQEDIVYTMPQVQQQKGFRDCGLFAIAFAFELCRGFEVTTLHLKQWEMREHLYQCFKNEQLESFPSMW